MLLMRQSMVFEVTKYGIWIGGFALQVAILGQMIRARWAREFPFFFAYLALSTIRSPILLYIERLPESYALYFYSYWLAEAVSIALGFAVIHELFSHAFRPYAALKRTVLLVFQSVLVILLLVAIWTAATAPAADKTWISAVVMGLERSLRIVQVGLLLLLFLLSRSLAISWGQRLFGIALGFGVVAAAQLGAIAVRAQMGNAVHESFALIKPGAYVCALLIWLAYTLRSEAAAPVKPRPLPSPHMVERWNQALVQLLHNK